MWEIKGKNGVVKASVNGVEFNDEWMVGRYVTVTVESPCPVSFAIGDYLTYRGERFEINYDPGKIKSAPQFEKGDAFKYENVKFNWLADELTRCDFLDVVLGDNQLHFTGLPKFSFYSNVRGLADRIQANLDRAYGKNTWQVIVSGEFSDSTELNVSVDTIKVSGALEILVNQFKAYYTTKGRTVTIGAAGVPADHLFKYGKGNGLYEIEQNAEADQAIVTRLRAYGSTRNIPHRYYNSLTDADGVKLIPDNMAVQYLMLPSFPYSTLDPYIDSPNIGALGVREGTIFFDGSNPDLPEIFPSIEGMTAEQLKAAGVQCNSTGALDVLVSAEQMTDNGVGIIEGDAFEGNATTTAEPATFKVTLPDIGFDIWTHRIEGQAAYISFKSGMLGAREFEIVGCTKEGDNYVLELNRVYDEDIKLWFPYKDYNAKSGDRYVLLAIKMPEVYVKAAAQRLKGEAEKWLGKNDYSRSVYAPKIDEIFMARQHDAAMASNGAIKSLHDTLCAGMQLLFEDEDLGIDAAIFIDRLTIKEEADKIPTYEVVLKEEKTVGRLDKMQNQIDSLASGQGQGGGGYNASQIRSLIAAYGGSIFLSKLKDDRSVGKVASDKGFEVGQYISGSQGGFFGIDADGENFAEVGRLFVRVKAFFEELTIVKSNVLGGKQYITPGNGIKCTSVEEVRDENNALLGWRCYFLSEQDGEKTDCKFIIQDQAISEEFNAKTGTSNKISNHFYWRAVTDVNQDAYTDDAGNHYGYIELSATNCAANSDAPAAGDEICQLGYQGTDAANKERQTAMVFSTVDSDSPSIKMYSGIGSGDTLAERFSLNDRAIIAFGRDNRGVYFRLGNSSATQYFDYTQQGGLRIAGQILAQSTIGDKSIEQYIKDVVPPVTKEDIEGYVNAIVDPKIDGIQDQIDGVVETWWGEGVPTMSNYPANQWTTDAEKEKHLSDLYCDNDTGFAYRFSKASDGTYFWNDKVDTATAKALVDAAKAQDTADGKRRVFVAQPTTPYDQGDIWVNATYSDSSVTYSNDILRCVAPKTSGQPFSISDWTLASKYTDDTLAQAAKNAADAAKTAADNAQADADAAKDRLDAWAADGVISPTEKQGIKDEIARIDGDKSHINAEYTKYDLGTPTAYNDAHAAYRAVLVTLSESTPENIPIPSDFPTKQGAYYTARTNALKAISNAADAYAQALVDDLDEKLSIKIAGYEYIKDAINKGATEINGGLFLSSHIKLGEWVTGTDGTKSMSAVYAGLNGLYHSPKTPFLWGGGDIVDKFYKPDGTLRDTPLASDYAKTLLRMDGSAYFSAGNVGFEADGSGWLGNKENGIKFSATGALTLGSGVYIDINGDKELKSTLESVVNFQTSFENFLTPCDAQGNEISWSEAMQSDGTGGIKGKSLKSKVGFWSSGFITAKGMNPNGDAAAGGGVSAEWLENNGYKTYADTLTGVQQWVNGQDFATKAWVEGKNFLTSHQAIRTLTIQKNGTAVGTFDPKASANKTINITDVASAATLSSHISDSVKHITADERTKWNATSTNLDTILGSDSNQIIDKWDEIVAFLANYDGADTLADLLSNKVDKVSGKGLSANDFTDTYKTKLDGIATGANKYILPTASSSTLGGVKIGANITITNGVISTHAPYSLPTASDTVKGGVKVGNGLAVTSDVLSVNLAAADIPSLDWSKITSGTPTTLAGYGITDAYTKSEIGDKVSALNTSINAKVSKSGDTMTGALQININSATKHLGFGRASWNYICATATGGVIAFVTNGKEAGIGPNADLAIAANVVRAGTDNLVSLGLSDKRWNNVYSVLGNFSGKVTAQSLKIGDCEITWDSVNNGLKFSKGIYSEGYVTAKGANASGGASAGGGIDIEKLKSFLNGTDPANTDGAYATQSWVLGRNYALASALTDGSVTKVGTASVGSATKPIYLNNGTPTASASTVGGTAKPVYLNAGTITALSATIGSASKPLYMSSGTLTACSYDIPTKMTQLTNNLFVVGTQTAATNVWTGNLDGLTAYYNGLTIDYYLPFAGTNTAATLNLNGLGAKQVYNGRGKGNTTTHFPQYSIIRMTYYNGAFHANAYWYSDTNTGYTAHGSCSTAAATAAKAVSMGGMVLTSGENFLIRFTQTNTAKSALTLNVNGQGAKPLYINGAASSASNYTLNAGVYPCYYDGTNWYVYTDGTYRFTNVLADKIAKVGGTSSQFLKADGSVDSSSYATTSSLSSYLPKSGGTLTGLLTAKTGATHTGIKLGKTYLSSLSDQVLLQNCDAIRFGGDSWDWNIWAGLKYVHTDKTIYLGLADGTIFNANSGQSGGSLKTPGISSIYIGTSTLVASQTWVSSNYQPKGSYATTSSLGNYLPLSGGTINGPLSISSGADGKIWLNNTNNETKYQQIVFSQNGTEYGRLGTIGSDALTWNNNTIWHSGNDGAGSGLDADLLDGWHCDDIRKRVLGFQRIDGSGTEGGYDLSTMLNDGGMTCQYSSTTWWSNAPNGMLYGGAICLKASDYTFLMGMLAWDINHMGNDVTRNLWWRAYAIGADGVNKWGNWHQLAFTDSNVASATRLQGTYSLWGQPFYGNNVSGDMTGVGSITASGTIKTTNVVFGYRYSTNNNAAAFVFDKPGSYQTGIGSAGVANTIRFGACGVDGAWVDNFDQNWGFMGNVGIGTVSPAYSLDVQGSAIVDNWIRTRGTGGWYNETFGGGWYMEDSYYIKNWNNKRLKIDGINDYCAVWLPSGGFCTEGVSGWSWNSGYGALNVGCANDQAQTPLIVGYRNGYTPDGAAKNRLFAMELHNSGAMMHFSFAGATEFEFSYVGLFRANGAIESAGYITAKTANSSSDARLKDVLDNILLDIDTMANAPSVRFRWKDSGEIAAGSIAQYWQPRLPEVVGRNGNGFLTLQYGVLGTLMGRSNAVHLRRHEHILLTHESRLQRLERENRELRQRITELENELLK